MPLLVRPCLTLVALVVSCPALSGPAPSRAFCLSPLAFLLLPRILLKMKSFLLILFEMARGIGVAHLRVHARHVPACAFVPCVCVRLRTRTCTRVRATPPRYVSAHASAHAPARMSALRIRTRLRTRVRVRLCRAPARALAPRIRAADSRISSETRYDARETEANPRLIERGGYDADRRDLRHARQA